MTFHPTTTLLVAATALACAPTAFAAIDEPPPTAAAAASSSTAHEPSTPHDHDMPSMQDDDMSSMSEQAASAPHGMPMGDHTMAMRSPLGPYAMSRTGSGTSWQPDATPMDGVHWMRGDWSLMAHGYVNAIADKQSGPRGESQSFAQSMGMLMGNRPLGAGTLGVRAMVSLDPAFGKGGYPLLFQTGETADGRTPLVDRQHPHDAVMELSTSYSLPLGDDVAVFAYVGLPGEPALGPTAFMHRWSGMRNPEAPLTHHWLDSTHITEGVATLGASAGPWQVEGSWFNGREPDQSRWNIETRRFDSWSARLSWNPLPSLSMQVSHGDLRSPEQLEPDTRVARTTASVSWQLDIGGDPWATTLAYGRNRKTGPDVHRSEPGWLLESTYLWNKRHTLFARVEQLDNSELLAEDDPLHGQAMRIRKLTVGGIEDVGKAGPVSIGIGGLIGLLDAPPRLDGRYGGSPRSLMLLVQGRL